MPSSDGCEIFTARTIARSPDDLFLAKAIARDHHPYYDRCSGFVQKLFDRNVNIILGACLRDPVPVACAIYWHEPDNDIDMMGGTNHSLRICRTYEIPTFNVNIADQCDKLEEFIYGV